MAINMCRVQVVIVIVMAVFGSIDSAVFPAGKCNTRHIEPVPIDLHKIAGYGKLNVLYGPEVGNENIDHSDLVFTQKDKNSYTVVNTRYFYIKFVHSKDRTTDKQTYIHSLVDDVILEDGIDAGKPFHFHVYPLTKTNEDAILFYRCADAGRQPVDTRFITVPAGKSLSDASLKQLLDADKKFNFRGSLYKFPNQQSLTPL